MIKKIETISIISLFLLAVVIPLLLTINRGAYAEVPPPPVTPPTPPNSGTPTVIPTMTVTPVPNRPPVITTWFLPPGKVNRRYNTAVSGFDWNKNDNLNIQITNLPSGLSQGICWQYVYRERKVINCAISGKPTSKGYYVVRVRLTDNRGGVDRKELPLVILP